MPTLLGGCSPVRILNSFAPDRLFRSDVAYGNQARQRLDIYKPAGAGPFPVAMFIYGGGWDSGDRRDYAFVGGALAAAGFLTIIPDYRLFPNVRFPTFLQDCASALAWVRREAPRFGGRPDAPWLIGHSAGAYNVAMLTLDPGWLNAENLSPLSDIRGAVGLSGPYDFLPLNTRELREIFAAATPLSVSQPITYVTGHAPPMLLLTGGDDHTVDPGNTVRLEKRIRAMGGSVEAKTYPGIDHKEIIGAFGRPLRFLAPSLHDTLTFMHAPKDIAS